ncbi:MAG: DUF4038 domain-containing protein, partial [Bacteroidales bacterium]
MDKKLVNNTSNNIMVKNTFNLILTVLLSVACTSPVQNISPGRIMISDNNRYFTDENGDPYFWLGDTGWLLFAKLNRQDAEKYLENRSRNGFNVIQVMVLHTLSVVNVYGDSALVNKDVSMPRITRGNNFEDAEQYDYWDHVDFIIDRAAEKNIYMALIPVWGSNVKSGRVSNKQAKVYSAWLAERYGRKSNIIWLNGGDIKGNDSTRIWNTIGYTLREKDPVHLISYHPFGRTQSSMWFHNESWLDFNMFQSGHRRYDQDDTELCYGEDNWRYVESDYSKVPVKPTLDGEPSYENIPQGLHDSLQPYWTDNDVRRYAYWSVFAGACGHTYGHNAVMQMHRPGDTDNAYGVKDYWYDAINHPGARQMIHLKNLMLSRPYFDRVPDQSLIAGDQGERYDYLVATRGSDYAFIYTYNGRNFRVNMGKIAGNMVKASWFNPRNGKIRSLGVFPNNGIVEFDPPGEKQDGNDWILIIDKTEEVFIFTSFREPATDGLYFLYSYDGYKWTDLGGTFLKPELGKQKLMRDPSIVCGPDSTFHLVWTTSWKGDNGFGYSSSKDLIHWENQEFIPVMQHEPSTVNVWAPELYYDDENKQFIIIWASTIPFRFERGIEDEDNNHRMYYTTTKDFKTFTKTGLFLEPGFSVIDAVIVKKDTGDYVLVLKDNTRPNRNLKVAFGVQPLGPYTGISEPFTGQFTEGPAVINTGEEWLIYYDAYREKKYGAVKTSNYKTFTNISGDINVPENHKHGTIFKTSEKILKGLIKE